MKFVKFQNLHQKKKKVTVYKISDGEVLNSKRGDGEGSSKRGEFPVRKGRWSPYLI